MRKSNSTTQIAGPARPRITPSGDAVPQKPVKAEPRRILLAMDYYLHQVHEGIVDYARGAGWILDARAQHHRELPAGWQAEGILMFIGSTDVFGPEIRATGLPMVNMSPWAPEYQIPSVQADNVLAGQMAAEHLMGRGFQNLSYVQFTPSSLTSKAREKGFREAVTAAGRQLHSLVSPHDETNGPPTALLFNWLREELRSLPRPLGIFTEGDLWAVETIQLCQQLGLRVPDDVAVLGIDNDPLVVDVAPVPVSSVDNNLHGVGFHAAALLDRMLSGAPPPHEPILIPPRGVVQRTSTNVVAVSDEDVAAAITFIHAHFREAITVADVAREAHISRRRLQDLFFQHVGRTISQEILRNRLELAKRMLDESPLKISLVAERCGLGNGVQMAKVFARELGTTPKAYRQQNAK